MIAVLPWKPQIFRLQLQLLSRCCGELTSEGVKWGMGWVVVGTLFWGGAPILHLLVENAVFSKVMAKNRGGHKNGHSYHHPSHPPTPSDNYSYVILFLYRIRFFSEDNM